MVDTDDRDGLWRVPSVRHPSRTRSDRPSFDSFPLTPKHPFTPSPSVTSSRSHPSGTQLTSTLRTHPSHDYLLRGRETCVFPRDPFRLSPDPHPHPHPHLESRVPRREVWGRRPGLGKTPCDLCTFRPTTEDKMSPPLTPRSSIPRPRSTSYPSPHRHRVWGRRVLGPTERRTPTSGRGSSSELKDPEVSHPPWSRWGRSPFYPDPGYPVPSGGPVPRGGTRGHPPCLRGSEADVPLRSHRRCYLYKQVPFGPTLDTRGRATPSFPANTERVTPLTRTSALTTGHRPFQSAGSPGQPSWPRSPGKRARTTL